MCVFVSHPVLAPFLVSPVSILACILALPTMEVPVSPVAIVVCCKVCQFSLAVMFAPARYGHHESGGLP